MPISNSSFYDNLSSLSAIVESIQEVANSALAFTRQSAFIESIKSIQNSALVSQPAFIESIQSIQDSALAFTRQPTFIESIQSIQDLDLISQPTFIESIQSIQQTIQALTIAPQFSEVINQIQEMANSIQAPFQELSFSASIQGIVEQFLQMADSLPPPISETDELPSQAENLLSPLWESTLAGSPSNSSATPQQFQTAEELEGVIKTAVLQALAEHSKKGKGRRALTDAANIATIIVAVITIFFYFWGMTHPTPPANFYITPQRPPASTATPIASPTPTHPTVEPK